MHSCAHRQLEDINCICFSTQSCECTHVLICKLAMQVKDATYCGSLVAVLRHGQCSVLPYGRYVGLLCIRVLGGQVFCAWEHASLEGYARANQGTSSQHVEIRLPTHLGCTFS